MAERLNLRVLRLQNAEEIAREVARIEPYPERVAATTPKARFMVVHARGMNTVAAMILKQELLALDADCVISPAAYLGMADSTDVLILATLRQYQALAPRLHGFPVEDLRGLGAELDRLISNLEQPPSPTAIGFTTFSWGQRTYVMGILNITPDSFSGDGLLARVSTDADAADQVSAAMAQARDFLAAGADILDVGGESTRPGGTPISAAEEIERVVPVIAGLRAAFRVPIAIDSYKAEVVAAALNAGADLVNDIWGLRLPEGGWNQSLAQLVAGRGAPIVLMHNRSATASTSSIGGHYPRVIYNDLLGEIVAELRQSLAYAEEQGIARDRIIVDPGIGFGKTPAQNVELLRQLSQLRALGRPILLGTSRKSFIGRVLGLEPGDRLEGTAATVALGIHAGADLVRVHDVAAMARVARMADALVRPGGWERAVGDQA